MNTTYTLKKNTKPIKQRQHRLNTKYSLMEKEETDKLLEIGFMFVVPLVNGWILLGLYPKRMAKFEYAKISRD